MPVGCASLLKGSLFDKKRSLNNQEQWPQMRAHHPSLSLVKISIQRALFLRFIILKFPQSVSGLSRFEKQLNCKVILDNTWGPARSDIQCVRTKCDDGPLFLGDGSLAAAPTPKLTQKGIRPVIKVIDDKCLYASQSPNYFSGKADMYSKGL